MAGPSDRLARAAELLAVGAWQQAHKIVQQEESALAEWLHGIEESGYVLLEPDKHLDQL